VFNKLCPNLLLSEPWGAFGELNLEATVSNSPYKSQVYYYTWQQHILTFPLVLKLTREIWACVTLLPLQFSSFLPTHSAQMKSSHLTKSLLSTDRSIKARSLASET